MLTSQKRIIRAVMLCYTLTFAALILSDMAVKTARALMMEAYPARPITASSPNGEAGRRDSWKIGVPEPNLLHGAIINRPVWSCPVLPPLHEHQRGGR